MNRLGIQLLYCINAARNIYLNLYDINVSCSKERPNSLFIDRFFYPIIIVDVRYDRSYLSPLTMKLCVHLLYFHVVGLTAAVQVCAAMAILVKQTTFN